MTETIPNHVDVLIVGGGGCGLTSAIFLANAGVDFLLIERREGTSQLPKAHYLNPRTMEILRQYDVAREVAAQGTPAYNRSRTKWYTSFGGNGPLDRKTLYETGSLGGHGCARAHEYYDACPIDSANLPQIRLEPIFLAEANRLAPGRLQFQHELISLEQDAAGATATIRDIQTDRTFTVRAKYVIGADGGRTVGPMVGIAQSGQKELITQVSVHFEADLSEWYPDDRVLLNWLRHPHLPGVAVIVAMGPGKWGRFSPEWSIGFAKNPFDPAPFAPEAAIPTIRKFLGIENLEIKVRRISEWKVEGVLADRYQAGRVFLAGDAAHRHPPTTGLGLNTAIQDAHGLAWRLALVVKGKADPSLLASYETERMPIGAFNVEWALNAFFNHLLLEAAITHIHPDALSQMQSPEHAEAAFTGLLADTANGRMRRAKLDKVFETQDTEFFAQDVELGFRYDTGALVPDGTPATPRDPIGNTYVPDARPGHRLPHCWLGRDGHTISTHDLVNRDGRFALIAGANGEAWVAAAKRAATSAGVGMEAVCVSLHGDVNDAESRWPALAGIGPEGAVLIRPDNIVAWRSAGAAANCDATMHDVFARILGHAETHKTQHHSELVMAK